MTELTTTTAAARTMPMMTMPEIRVTNTERRHSRSQTPGPARRMTGKKHRRSQSSKSSITTQGSPAKRPMSRKIVPEDFPTPVTTPRQQFDAYLRVSDSWQPTPGTSPGAGPGHQYIALREGDVVLQHARYPSGWAYGQTLTTGAYGFLPANHCEPFHPHEVSELLDALLNVWTSFGAHQEDPIAAHTIQDNVSSMLGGVRLFLKRMHCLEGDATLVKSNTGIWKMRKSLLGDFHVFVKASKMLQELYQSRTDNAEDRQFVLVKACKVAMRAVRFLDMWNGLMDERLDADQDQGRGQSQPAGNDLETPVSVVTALPTSVDARGEYPFPNNAQQDQSTIHPAFRRSNDDEAKGVPQTAFASPTRGAATRMSGLHISAMSVGGSNDGNTRMSTAGGATGLGIILKDLPGLISGEDADASAGAGVLHASPSQPSTNTNAALADAGTQRPHMIASSISISTISSPSTWAERDSSLPAGSRKTSNEFRSSLQHQPNAAVISSTSTWPPVVIQTQTPPPGLAASASAPHLPEQDPKRIDGHHNFSCETTPTPTPTPTRPSSQARAQAQAQARRRPLSQQQQQSRRTITNAPIASDSLNVDRQPTHATLAAPPQSYTESTESLNSGQLASHKLTSAHDAFLGLLGVYIGGHLTRRSTMDLYRTTHETSESCQALLDVVLEIWQRDGQQSIAVDKAAQAMRTQFAELYDLTSDILKSSAEATTEADAVLVIPNHNGDLTEAATNCARSAGDCVSKTRAILERLGDFDFDGHTADGCAGAGHTTAGDTTLPTIPTLGAQAQPLTATNSTSSDSLNSQPASDSAKSGFSSSHSPRSLAAYPPPSAPPPPPPHATSTIRTVTPFVSNLLAEVSASKQNTATLAPGAGHDKHDTRHMPVPGRADVASLPMLDVELPPLSPIDFPQSRTSFSSVQSNTNRADSVGASVANSTSTRLSSFRHSDASIVSSVSTRATTPDRGLRRDVHDRALNESFGTTSSEVPSLPQDDDKFVEAHAHELVTNSHGQIAGGTLPALVEKLTPCDSHPDSVFLNTFYLTFRLFTMPTEFAQCLIDRFVTMSEQYPTQAVTARLRIYNIFKGWLENHWRADTDAVALPIISDFAYGPLKLWLTSPSKRLIELVERLKDMQHPPLTHRTVSGMRRPNTATSPVDDDAPTPQITKAQLASLRKAAQDGGHPCNVLSFDPLELARHFTIIESRLFCTIEPEEFLGHVRNQKDQSKVVNIRAMSSLWNDVVNLVTDTILQFEEPKKRALAIKHWIAIARHCLDLANYDTIFAIMTSLSAIIISRLEKTWSFIHPKSLATYHELEKLTDVTRNRAEFRKRLTAHANPCLPFVGMYLTDLLFTDEGIPSTRRVRSSIVAGGAYNPDPAHPAVSNTFRPISLSPIDPSPSTGASQIDDACTISGINFYKYMKTARIIFDIQRFQVPYKLQTVPELMDWLERQLSRVRASKDDMLVTHDRRSRQLEPRKGLDGGSGVMGRGSRERDDLLGMVMEAGIAVDEGMVAAAGGAGVGVASAGSARGRLQWARKMKFGASRERSGS